MHGSGEILLKIENWMKSFVEVQHPSLAGFAPCPYARRTRMQNQMSVRIVNRFTLHAELESANLEIQNGEKLVGLLVFEDTDQWPVEDISKQVQRWREEGRVKDLYYLRDHPLDKEVVNGVCMNQGEFLIVFVQKLSKLTEATAELKSLGYYESWNHGAVTDVIGSRFE